jgi:hypothetical protein
MHILKQKFNLFALTWGDPKILGIVKKNLFKVFVQVWKFSPLRSTHPATGCSNPSTAPNAENAV